MDSAGSMPESAWTFLDSLAAVPMWMWAAGAVAGLFGILVLVFPFSPYLITRCKNAILYLKSMFSTCFNDLYIFCNQGHNPD